MTLLAGTMSNLDSLQRAQNSAAHVLTRTIKQAHITPVLKLSLHWMPVRQRINFKILMLVYILLHDICTTVPSESSHSPRTIKSTQVGTGLRATYCSHDDITIWEYGLCHLRS